MDDVGSIIWCFYYVIIDVESSVFECETIGGGQ
jgi:hypothetical protein